MAATTSPSPNQSSVSSLVDGPMYHLCRARHCASIALARDAFNCCFLARALTCSPFTRRSLPCGPPASGVPHLAPHRPQTCWALPRQQHRPSYPPMHYFCWSTVMATRDDTPRSQVVSERLGLRPTVQLNQPKVVRVRASMHATIQVQQLVMVSKCVLACPGSLELLMYVVTWKVTMY
ncbi:hypothetical protein BC826DRAFT_162044 [Russula brevipes]|nr:hypothetical protein BC826DRAFT_162044 [Russula brevipes]